MAKPKDKFDKWFDRLVEAGLARRRCDGDCDGDIVADIGGGAFEILLHDAECEGDCCPAK